MTIKQSLLALAISASLFSCSKDDNATRNPGNFVVAVSPVAATGVADYLLTAASLEEGTISNAGQGVEQDGTYRYYVTTNNKLYSMLYGQGNPGAITVYNILGGNLNKIANTVTETVQAFTPVKDDILMMKISRNITNPVTTWYRFNTNGLKIDGQGDINTAEITKNGELAFFSWIKQVGDKVYAPFFSVKGCCSATFGTAFPDKAWVAIFSYPDMKLEKVIEDTRTSFIGRYFTDAIEPTENGDVYTFSSAIASSGGTDATINTTKPSAVTRIKAGTTVFDSSYFFDIEAATGGLNITNWKYLGNNNFIIFSNTKAEKGLYKTGNIVGVINVANKTYKAVTGLPAAEEIKGFTGTNNYAVKDGRTGHIGVNLKSGVGYIYKIDATTATATRGLKVEGGTITAIEHLN